jgi:hypothetical protein
MPSEEERVRDERWEKGETRQTAGGGRSGRRRWKTGRWRGAARRRWDGERRRGEGRRRQKTVGR